MASTKSRRSNREEETSSMSEAHGAQGKSGDLGKGRVTFSSVFYETGSHGKGRTHVRYKFLVNLLEKRDKAQNFVPR